MLLKFTDRKGQPCSIVKEKIVAMYPNPNIDGEVHIYVDASDTPFAVICTIEQAFQIYDGAWLVPKSYGPPQEPVFQYQQNLDTIEVEAEHRANLNK